MRRPNGQARAAVAWGAVSAIGLAGAVLPLALGMSGVEGGYALTFAGALLAVIGAAAAAVFTLRARLLSRLFAGSGVLAHWTYPEGVGELLSDCEAFPRRTWGRVLFPVGIPICVGIASLCLFADPGAARRVLPILFGAILIAGALTALEPTVRRAKRERAPREAIVSLDVAYAFGAFHVWSQWGASIVDAGVVPGRAPLLRVSYLRLAAPGRQLATVAIPIPPGEEARAWDVARALLRTQDSPERPR